MQILETPLYWCFTIILVTIILVLIILLVTENYQGPPSLHKYTVFVQMLTRFIGDHFTIYTNAESMMYTWN